MATPDLKRDSKQISSSVATEQMPQSPDIQTGEGTQETPTQKTTPETAVEFERNKEKQENSDSGTFDKAIDLLTKRLRKPKKSKPTAIPQVRDEVTVQVEKILEEGLEDAYRELSTLQKQELKIQGEKTALEIRRLLKGTHVKVKKIFVLIVEWLKILPGINRFFIEQEAKIKADKIIALKERLDHPDQP